MNTTHVIDLIQNTFKGLKPGEKQIIRVPNDVDISALTNSISFENGALIGISNQHAIEVRKFDIWNFS